MPSASFIPDGSSSSSLPSLLLFLPPFFFPAPLSAALFFPAPLSAALFLPCSSFCRPFSSLLLFLPPFFFPAPLSAALFLSQTDEMFFFVNQVVGSGGVHRLYEAERATGEHLAKMEQRLQAIEQQLLGRDKETRGREEGRKIDYLVKELKTVSERLEERRKEEAADAAALSKIPPIDLQPKQLSQLTPLIIEEDSPLLWQQRSFRRSASYGFIRYSSYRVSPSLIAVLGIGASGQRERRQLTGCWWVEKAGESSSSSSSSVIEGVLTAEYMEEHHDLRYEFILLLCSLSRASAQSGGHLKMEMDGERTFPFREDSSEALSPDPPSNLKHRLAFCGPPVFGQIEGRSISQWVDYHRYHLQVEHSFLYDAGGITTDMQRLLQPYLDIGTVSITDFREAVVYEAWAESQALAMHDCLYRNKGLSEWVLYADFDEYLHVPPPNTISSLLKQHKDKVWISFGAYFYATDKCLTDGSIGGTDVWAAEKMAVEFLPFREYYPFCMIDGDKSLCLTHWGHRKIFANTWKMKTVYVHEQGSPREGGVDLKVEAFRQMHFREIGLKTWHCSTIESKSLDAASKEMKKNGFVVDDSVAEIAAAARWCAKQGLKGVLTCEPPKDQASLQKGGQG